MPLRDLTKQEHEFALSVAHLAAQDGILPHAAMRAFGALSRHLVEDEERRGGTGMELDELTQVAFKLLLDGFGAVGTVNVSTDQGRH